jgi:hypothetical protein
MGLKSYIEREGYQVISLNAGQMAGAYIITKLDENATGDMTRTGEGFLINAKGRQPEEIIFDLQKHFNLM